MDGDIYDDKPTLSSLVERVALGEEMNIAAAEKPVTDRLPVEDHPKWVFGTAKGEFTVPDDFNDPLPKEIEDLFW